MDFRVKYKNNRYKYSGGKWYFLSGENGWYISEVKEQGVIDNLNKFFGEIDQSSNESGFNNSNVVNGVAV